MAGSGACPSLGCGARGSLASEAVKGQDWRNAGSGGRMWSQGPCRLTRAETWEQGLRGMAYLGEKKISHLVLWREEGRGAGC